MADSGTGYQSHLAEDRQRLVDLQIVLVLWTDSKDRRPYLWTWLSKGLYFDLLVKHS